MVGSENKPYLGNLLLENIHLIQEQDNRRPHEPLRMHDAIEQHERLRETVLEKR